MNFEDKLNQTLQILLEDEKEQVGHPTTWGVLYVHPNPDGSKKKCENCIMWVEQGAGKCNIHKKSLKITKSMVCGYHVFGEHMEKWADHPGIEPVDEKLSGLEEVGEGTICGNCKHYDDGKCYAVAPKDGQEPPADVEEYGCCARWVKA